MSENTAAHDLALRMIGDERQAIFFVGYADRDTPGGRLKAAKPGQTFMFSGSGGEVTRRCELDDFDLTAHANRDEVVELRRARFRREQCCWVTATRIRANGSSSRSARGIRRSKSSSPGRARRWKCDGESSSGLAFARRAICGRNIACACASSWVPPAAGRRSAVSGKSARRWRNRRTVRRCCCSRRNRRLTA